MSSGSWIRATRRWALYLRDGLTCVYCQRTLADLTGDGSCLVLDHILPRRYGGRHDDDNLTTACYECNRDRKERTVSGYCASTGLVRSSVLRRINTRRRDTSERHTTGARILLGLYPGVPRSDLAVANDRAARALFGRGDASYEWLADFDQTDLLCATCCRPFPRHDDGVEVSVSF